jgi:Ran-binding protein 3
LASTAAANQACDAPSLPESVATAPPKAVPAPSPAASVSGVKAEGGAAEEKEEQDDAKQGTGEEDEEVIFHAECKLSKLVRHAVLQMPATDTPSEAPSEGGSSPGAGGAGAVSGASAAAGQENGWRWQEKGCGILHINWNAKNGSGRLVMRMRGVLKVLLNTPVFPTTKYERVGQKSVRFVGIDVEDHSKDGQIPMCAFRLTLQNSDQLAKLLSVLQPICSGSEAK